MMEMQPSLESLLVVGSLLVYTMMYCTVVHKQQATLLYGKCTPVQTSNSVSLGRDYLFDNQWQMEKPSGNQFEPRSQGLVN